MSKKDRERDRNSIATADARAAVVQVRDAPACGFYGIIRCLRAVKQGFAGGIGHTLIYAVAVMRQAETGSCHRIATTSDGNGYGRA